MQQQSGPDRRSVGDLSTKEIERVLAERKRQEQARRLRRLADQGRVLTVEAEPGGKCVPEDGQALVAALDHLTGRRRVRDAQERQDSASRLKWGLAWGWVLNKALLLFELLVVSGLILLMLTGFVTWRDLNLVAYQAFATPTPAPQPLIDVVLPDGHRPPSAQSEAEPNPDEIPEHLRALVQAVTPLPIPTRGSEQPTRIVIRSINVDALVVEGDDWEQLKKGVGHHLGTANPGERGNMVLSGHDDVYGEVFRYLHKVELGDEILVYSGSHVFRYVVTQKRIIEPTQVSVMYPTSEPTLTLITCYPYLVDNMRIIVIAELGP